MVSTDTPSGAPHRKPVAQLRYELLTLGDELLLGLTANSHLTFIGQQLGRRGVLLQRQVTITDEADAIEAQFRESWARADVVITTGGLGPTCDDRTREALAEALGQQLVFDPAIEQAIKERFARFGREMTPNNLKQAYKFERGEVLPNPNGTAPGLWVEQDGKVLCMLPGPPHELTPMFTDQVLPRLARLGLVLDREAYVQIRTAGIGESTLEHKLQSVFDRYGDALSVAYCAHAGQVDFRLSSPSGRLDPVQIQQIAAECALLLGDDFMVFGHDPLARVCADMLRATQSKIAVVESATGGLLAEAFTSLCGIGKFFAGGCVCCCNDAKQQLLDVPEEIILQHGAVSAETAVALCTGAAERLGADYALAVTTFAPPCNVPQSEQESTIFMALYAPHGVWAKKLSYPGSRCIARQRAVTAALDWLRRELLHAQRGDSPSVHRPGTKR